MIKEYTVPDFPVPDFPTVPDFPISKTVNGTTTYYYYSDEGLAAEADNTGAITQTYGYAPNSIWGTNPIYTKAGGSYHYYLNDHLGTPQQLALKNGAKTWSAVYEAFGKATVTTSTITNNLRLPGQYADSETGLHYNWNRTYDNQTGRYIKADPIGLRGGLNVFGYVDASPLINLDPLGLKRPYDESFTDCSHYSPGGVLDGICSNAGDGGWTNCSRKCLKDFYPGGFSNPTALDYVFWIIPQHPICWLDCTDDDQECTNQ